MGVSYPARTRFRNKTNNHEEDHVVKATIIAKPKSHEVTPMGAVKVVIDFQYEKPIAFPKGVPPLPTQPFTITAFVGSKQWKKVEPTLADPEDKLILDGQFAVDPALGLVLHCTNASSLKLQRAGKETPAAEPKAESGA
jgi:hypothetical protein